MAGEGLKVENLQKWATLKARTVLLFRENIAKSACTEGGVVSKGPRQASALQNLCDIFPDYS